ncbi:GntR family transcriptional regulator [Streptomyces sp. NPDC021056]|uniref:GntR family transcriptional regulator n=1 Tax=Streptomyces sp. NPDC021056 TaxID=3155012 RepID=UPI0033CC2EAF
MSPSDGGSTAAPGVDDEPTQGHINNTAQAYAQVRRAIMTSELRPGQIISQVRLAAQLNISRTPLREALRQLQTEGLLEGDFNRRVRVAPMSIEDLEQIAAMRITLESLGVRSSVPRLTHADLARAEAACQAMDECYAARFSEGRNFRDPHRVFHTTLFGQVGSRMRAQLEDLWDHAERYRTFYFETAPSVDTIAHIGHDEHAAILAAAQRRDGQECGILIARHLARTALTSLARIDAAHDPWLVREAVRLATSGTATSTKAN